nr:hypothetical protein [Tanacetum cinerariifolium]
MCLRQKRLIEERDIEMGLLGNLRETRANLPIDIYEMVLSNKYGLVEDFSGTIEVFEATPYRNPHCNSGPCLAGGNVVHRNHQVMEIVRQTTECKEIVGQPSQQEFMEHDENPLSIDIRLLAALVEK